MKGHSSHGDGAALREYLSLNHRDRRFDLAVIDAVKNGGGVSAVLSDRILSRYLANRAKFIARSPQEVIAAITHPAA